MSRAAVSISLCADVFRKRQQRRIGQLADVQAADSLSNFLDLKKPLDALFQRSVDLVGLRAIRNRRLRYYIEHCHAARAQRSGSAGHRWAESLNVSLPLGECQQRCVRQLAGVQPFSERKAALSACQVGLYPVFRTLS